MSESFRKWVYHAEKPACIVTSTEELEALGPGWVESPVELEASPSAPVEPEGSEPELEEEPAAEQAEPEALPVAAPAPKLKGKKGKAA